MTCAAHTSRHRLRAPARSRQQRSQSQSVAPHLNPLATRAPGLRGGDSRQCTTKSDTSTAEQEIPNGQGSPRGRHLLVTSRVISSQPASFGQEVQIHMIRLPVLVPPVLVLNHRITGPLRRASILWLDRPSRTR